MSTGVAAETALALVQRYRREIPEWGHLPAAMRLKRSAVEQLGMDAAFDICRQALALPHSDRLQRRRLRSLAEVACNDAAQCTLLWPPREAFDRPGLRVIGPGNHTAMPGIGRSAFLCRLQDVTVRSRSALLLQGDEAIMDYEGSEYAGVSDLPGFDPAVLHGDADALWTFEAAGEVPGIEEGFHLLARNAVDFGHWLTEYLPRYVLARMAGLPASVPVLVDPVLPRNMRQALQDLLPEQTRIVALPGFEQARVKRLWVAANPNFSAFYPADWGPEVWSQVGNEPQAMARVLHAWLELLGPALGNTTANRRLYLARKPDNPKKRLLNHPDVEALVRSLGFDIVYPEDHPLMEQIRMVQSAGFIIAPEGSNALLSWFARAGTRVCLLSPPYTLPLVEFNAILAERGIDLTVLTGPDELAATDEFCGFWNDYRIDPSVLRGFLQGHWGLA